MALVTPTEPVPLEELGRVHFVGIGGAGMSGIARIMLARGVEVSGSDNADSAALAELAALGARVCVGHAAGQLGDADTLVVSSAIRATNPELVEANDRGLRVLHRAAALASLMVGRQVIAVTGTHGKTSTTSMIATVLIETGTDPAYAIGGVLAATGVGAADGDGRFFVAEADESDGSFLMYAPDVAVVTNVDADHLDNYGTEAAYRASFTAFLGRVTPGGLVVTCADDSGTRDLADQARARGLRVVSYGESADADYRVADVIASGMATSFTLRANASPADPSSAVASPTEAVGQADTEPRPGQSHPGPFGRIDLDLQLRVPGRHNALNATAAFAAAVELGLEPGRVAAALTSYRGAARRLEPKGEAGGVRVLDTYAHHPTELAADLRAARGIATGGGRVIAVFQPHLFSRTRIFAAEFGAALGLADEAVVLDVYAAREDPEPGVTGRLVADAVPGGAARYVPHFADVPAVVAALAEPGDLVLTMGAGDITKMGPLVLDEIAASGAGATTP
ncbi:MAG TPA: UDP-N-acetylmuramate--L-alanine ligase [Trebonia sp.]|jgi:UDP-N-acetylmuramate--alanine ligase|nr:UDP-N-acetylmuramate--L-alanine ligase [Trebonia sp.]